MGGAKTAFVQMVEDLTSFDSVDVAIINLSRPLRGRGKILRACFNLKGLFKTLMSVIRHGSKHEVWALNISPHGAFSFLPLLVLLGRFFNKPIIVRMFGGSLYDEYSALSPLSKWVFKRSVRRCQLMALETQYLLDRFTGFDNVERFPNTRNCPLPPIAKTTCKNFVFLSQIRQEKGVHEVLNAAEQLSGDIQVKFYGSPMDETLVNRIQAMDNCSFHGELQPEQVYAVLRASDALLLPTYWQGEGLPGVIVEAFQSGVPVITTRWKQVPELVSDGCNGLLVAPKNSTALLNAMDTLIQDHTYYKQLCEGATKAGESFRSIEWNSAFLHWCIRAKEQHNNKIVAK